MTEMASWNLISIFFLLTDDVQGFKNSDKMNLMVKISTGSAGVQQTHPIYWCCYTTSPKLLLLYIYNKISITF